MSSKKEPGEASRCHDGSKAGRSGKRRSFWQRATLALMAPVLMAAIAPTAMAQGASASKAPDGKCDPYKDYSCLDSYLGTGVVERLINYYPLEMGHGAAPADPAAPESRRKDFPPAATTVPPMPFTEWPYGGATAFGATRPNSVDSPLMTSIANTAVGKWMSDNHFQLYGWLNVGGNLSTNSTKPGGNWPAAYLYTPNTVQLDQAVLYLDRFPDTVQKDHIDWGMRLSVLYGENYRYTTSYGVVSDQLLVKNKTNGWDFPMVYGELFVPWVGEGLMFRVGRYISLPDIEAQLAPNNYMYTHSMTYTYDNYTNEGILASLMATKNLMFQFGVTAGTEAIYKHLYQSETNPYPNDPANGQVNPLYPNSTFRKDPGAKPSVTLCSRYNNDDSTSAVQFCANGINSGTYGYNNLQWFGMTAYHRFDEHWHVSAELYNEHQNDVPNANNTVVQTIYANGGSPFSSTFMPYNAPNLAQCKDGNALTCKAQATGFVTYINYSPGSLDNFSLRLETYFDPQGQRTGTAATYKNAAVGWQHWFSPQIEVRPELAYYHANNPAFNGNYNAGIAPNRKTATILSGDVIFHF